MKLSQFKFKLPPESVALYPHSIVREYTNDDGTKGSFRITRRDESRLMVLHRTTGEIELYKKDDKGQPIKGEYLDFRNVIDYFDDGDVFILNDTKVFPARLEPARKIRIGNKLFFDEVGTMVAEVYDNTTSRGRSLRFLYDCPHDQFKRDLFALGEAPLPEYVLNGRPEDPDMKGMHVHSHATKDDLEDFQTLFARNEGAVTVPATGLHFSRELLKRMEIKGINTAFITLHCGLGNFSPIEVEDLTKHKMDSEQMFVNKEACDMVNTAKKEGHHICAVGTSVAKATETAVGTDGFLKEYEGWTSKFIFPPYEFGLADTMIANFYHPESTLLMSTAAFGGYENVMACYALALKHGYKFGTTGCGIVGEQGRACLCLVFSS